MLGPGEILTEPNLAIRVYRPDSHRARDGMKNNVIGSPCIPLVLSHRPAAVVQVNTSPRLSSLTVSRSRLTVSIFLPICLPPDMPDYVLTYYNRKARFVNT